VIAALSLLFLVQAAGADILWDQSTLDLAAPGIANSESPGFGGFEIHTVGDVMIAGTGWSIETITLYYSSWNQDWLTAVTQGYLHVFPKNGSLPTEDPTQSQVIAMSASWGVTSDIIEVAASGLGLWLDPGEYWIAITPMGPAGLFGANLQFPTAVIGDQAASYDTMFPGWTNMYPGYDGAMLIEGEMAVPVESSSWGGIKSIYR
jgi:hypothetical protein